MKYHYLLGINLYHICFRFTSHQSY